ncbi:MAG TPA: ATP synthase F0 subunit B [Planctomycetia bacterium]|nr:ATP synthase F0 subunit B [Planctomycetia bacterium]
MTLFAAIDPAVDLPLWALFTSVLFYGMLAYFAGPALVKGLANRQASVAESLARADVARQEAAALRAKFAAEKKRIEQEAAALLEEGKRDAQDLRSALVAHAKSEIARMEIRTTRETNSARQAAEIELYRAAANRSVDVASAVLAKSLRADDQKRLVGEGIAAVGAYTAKEVA